MNSQVRSERNVVGKGILVFLSLGVAAYAAFAYTVVPLGAMVTPEMQQVFVTHPIGIYGHIAGGVIALILGPFQFYSRLRAAAPKVHRWIGRVYLLVGGTGIGVFGLYMSQYAYGGIVGRLGFGALAICWIYCAVRAYVAIRQGAIQKHRKWMVRSFSLTFAAVTLRIYLPLSAVAGVDFAVAYPMIAWLAWVPNLIVAEWLFNTAQGGARRQTAVSASARSSDR